MGLAHVDEASQSNRATASVRHGLIASMSKPSGLTGPASCPTKWQTCTREGPGMLCASTWTATGLPATSDHSGLVVVPHLCQGSDLNRVRPSGRSSMSARPGSRRRRAPRAGYEARARAQVGSLFALVRLQRQQSVWRFSSVDTPPLETGMMWSTSSRRCGST